MKAKLFIVVLVTLLVSMSLAVSLGSASATAGPLWSVPMTVAAGSEGHNSLLAFGVWPGATNSFDSGKDLPNPPPPPGATFNSYFKINDFLFKQLCKDYRAPAVSISWTLHINSDSENIVVSWDNSSLPSGWVLTINAIDMGSVGQLTLSAGSYNLTITAHQ